MSEMNGAAQTVVLRVGMHCDACRRKVRDAVCRLDGVNEVIADVKTQKVTVKGILDPKVVLKRILKTGKSAQILEIVLVPKPEEPSVDANAEPPKPPDPPKIITVILKVMMHCDHCTRKVRKALQKVQGVQEVNVDFQAQKVFVKGTIDPNTILVEALKTGKYIELIPQPEEKKEEVKEDKKEDSKEEKKEEAKEEKKEEAKEEKKEESKEEKKEEATEEKKEEVKEEKKEETKEEKKEEVKEEKIEEKIEETKEATKEEVKEEKKEESKVETKDEKKDEKKEEKIEVKKDEKIEELIDIGAKPYLICRGPPNCILFSDENPNGCLIM